MYAVPLTRDCFFRIRLQRNAEDSISTISVDSKDSESFLDLGKGTQNSVLKSIRIGFAFGQFYGKSKMASVEVDKWYH